MLTFDRRAARPLLTTRTAAYGYLNWAVLQRWGSRIAAQAAKPLSVSNLWLSDDHHPEVVPVGALIPYGSKVIEGNSVLSRRSPIGVNSE